MSKKTITIVSVVAFALILSTGHAFADANNTSSNTVTAGKTALTTNRIKNMSSQTMIGKVSAISGTTLTVTTLQKKNQKTYTVTADSATVTKAGKPVALGTVAIGDFVFIHASAAISGTAFTATSIMDGLPDFKTMMNLGGAKHTPPVFGKVTGVSGNVISVATKEGKNSKTATVTVGAKTKYEMSGKKGAASLSDVTVGATVIVMTRGADTLVHILPVSLKMQIPITATTAKVSTAAPAPAH